MTEQIELSEIIKDRNKFLQKTDAKIHTQYKIKYVKDYIISWLSLAVQTQRKNITFIDCMCNAGVYKNGILCTCTEILILFISQAVKYPNKNFNIFLNDIDSERITTVKQVFEKYGVSEYKNINIFYDNLDVTDYLAKDIKKYNVYFKDAFTILYVDPYNFGIPLLKQITSFINEYYCELIYNLFSSDITRNINNAHAPQKIEMIKSELSGVIDDFTDVDVLETVLNIQKQIKNTNFIKYSFVYPFKSAETNVELYYIMYFTPSKRGLEFLKNSIWNIFEGEPSFNKNYLDNKGVPTLLDLKDMLADQYAEDIKVKIVNHFKNQKVSYEQIEIYVLENSFLNEGQILRKIIKPLIQSNAIVKNNIFGSKNYKQDYYNF